MRRKISEIIEPLSMEDKEEIKKRLKRFRIFMSVLLGTVIFDSVILMIYISSPCKP
jgi:hypothetical protein